MCKYYLVSTELREAYTPRECKIIKKLKSDLRNDLALVEITPPLSKDVYNTENNINKLILCTRFKGSTLFPVSNLPLYVYICQLKSQNHINCDTINSDDLRILDWGELIGKLK